MTTKKKAIINARRNAKAAVGKVRNVQRKLSHAQMEAQIALLEEQIEMLTSGSGLQTSGKMSDSNPEARSLKPEAAPNDKATFLQTWLDEQQIMFGNFSELVPELENTVLTTGDRRRLHGSGVRRYGFIDKVSDVSEEFPQFWLASVNGKGDSVDFQSKLDERLREIEVLRNVLAWQQYVNRVVGDLLLLAGDDAFRMARTYYGLVRTAARNNLPQARQVFQLLNLFWRHPSRASSSDEPTIPEVERDARGLLRGSKEGTITISNESDQVVRGERVVIDNTQRRPRGGVRVVEES